MHDDLSDEVGVFDFDEFADYLLDQGLQASPSQLHGCLSGLLSAGASHEAEYGLDALTQSLNLNLHGELASRVMQLYSVTADALQDDEFTFHPMLPDDEEDIVARTAALASWCEGFLAGFAYRLAGEDASSGSLSEEAGEVLRDIAAMAQAEAGPDETNDDAEESFSELVEYLRVAVVNIFMDSSATISDRALSSETGRRLH
jgi:yecA family protein